MTASHLQTESRATDLRRDTADHRTRRLDNVLATINGRLERLPLPRAATTVYVGSVLWSLAFAIASVIRYSHFRDRRYDLGNFTQAVWATAHGHFLEVTNVSGSQVSRLGIHVDPIIAALAPLWWLWPSPKLLLTVQAVAMGAGAIPLFWLARKHLERERDAAFIACAYLLCPSVGWNTLIEFHATALAVPLLLLAVWVLDEGRLAAFAGCALAAILCQEVVGLIVACLGLWFGFRAHYRRPGLAIAAGGLVVTAVDFGLILRQFGSGTPYSGRYAAVGGSISGIAKTALADPMKIAATVQPSDVINVIILLLPVLGLSLLSPLIVAALPQAFVLTLSGNPYDWSYQAQNVLLIVPFVYAATVFALARRERREAKRQKIRAEHLFAVSLILALVIGPILSWTGTPPQLDAERQAVSLVPKDARVATTNYLGSHLAARRYVYVFPATARADWVVVDSSDAYLPPVTALGPQASLSVGAHDLYWQPKLMNKRIRDLQHSSAWKEVFAASTIHVFARRTAVTEDEVS